MKFYPRLTAPDELNPCYTTIPVDCLKIGNSTLPNCVGYVISRIIEIYGSQYGLIGTNANVFLEFNEKLSNWQRTSKIKLGAIACWNGHIAIVEKYENNIMTVSQSHYNGNRFDTMEIEIGSSYNGMCFQGFLIKTNSNWDNEYNSDESITFPKLLTDEYYRVRLSWDDVKSQIGAYHYLPNAINDAKLHPGYHVFDPSGRMVE